MPAVESLEKMPEVKAEKLIREHERMLTTLQNIRRRCKTGIGSGGYEGYEEISDMVTQTLGT